MRVCGVGATGSSPPPSSSSQERPEALEQFNLALACPPLCETPRNVGRLVCKVADGVVHHKRKQMILSARELNAQRLTEKAVQSIFGLFFARFLDALNECFALGSENLAAASEVILSPLLNELYDLRLLLCRQVQLLHQGKKSFKIFVLVITFHCIMNVGRSHRLLGLSQFRESFLQPAEKLRLEKRGKTRRRSTTANIRATSDLDHSDEWESSRTGSCGGNRFVMVAQPANPGPGVANGKWRQLASHVPSHKLNEESERRETNTVHLEHNMQGARIEDNISSAHRGRVSVMTRQSATLCHPCDETIRE